MWSLSIVSSEEVTAEQPGGATFFFLCVKTASSFQGKCKLLDVLYFLFCPLNYSEETGLVFLVVE